MTEEEKKLDKQLAELFEITGHGKAFLSPRIRVLILALFKEAGWKSPEDWDALVDRFPVIFKEWAKANGYMRLADDQGLPDVNLRWSMPSRGGEGYEQAQQDMLRQGFRKGE